MLDPQATAMDLVALDGSKDAGDGGEPTITCRCPVLTASLGKVSHLGVSGQCLWVVTSLPMMYLVFLW